MVRKYSIFITLIVMAFIAIVVLVIELAGSGNTELKYLITGLVSAGAIFLVIRIFFIRLVEERINPIIRSIQSYTHSRNKLRSKIEKEDVISDLNQEVKIWTDNQTEEINKLRQLEKYRKDFLGNVSHELKTPIFNIQGYILTLLDGGMEDINVNKLYLKRAAKSTNRLINIIDDLDSIARLESGEFKLQMESFNLTKVVEDVLEDQDMQAKNMNIKIGFDGKLNKPVMVVGDRKRIREVIGNLVNNSIKYGKDKGKTTISFVDTGENILVDISDDGIGIDEKDLPRIFERFYRVDKSRSRESGGTGLGLSIVKHTIQAHNQTITVRSKSDTGSTFVFSLDKA